VICPTRERILDAFDPLAFARHAGVGILGIRQTVDVTTGIHQHR
jgi:hypothetical protein